MIERREQVSLDRKVGELQAAARFSGTDNVGQLGEQFGMRDAGGNVRRERNIARAEAIEGRFVRASIWVSPPWLERLRRVISVEHHGT